MKLNNLPNKKYNIILADPAWNYEKSGGISKEIL